MTEESKSYQNASTSLLQEDRGERIHHGETLFQEGMIEEAKTLFESLLAEIPDDPEILNNLGVIACTAGAVNEAKQYFEKCLAHAPSNPDAIENLRMLTEALGSPCTTEREEEKEPPSSSTSGEPILIVMEEGIGNMIMLTSAIRAIKEIRHDLPIHVLGRYPALEVIEGWELVDRVLTEPDESIYETVFYTIWSQQNRDSHEKHLHAHCRQEGTIAYHDPSLHESEYHMEIARHLGYTGPTPEPYCPVAEVVSPFEVGKPVIGLADTYLANGAWDRKSWPHYPSLAADLIRQGFTVALFGGQDEADRFDPRKWPEGIIDLQGKYSVAESARLMKACSTIILNDSGPAHMAAAVGARTRVLFGATRTAKNSPRGKTVKILTAGLSCSPCQYTPDWQACSDWKCMADITVDQVLKEIEETADPGEEKRTADILLVGVTDRPESTNTAMRKGFEARGYTVETYNYRTKVAQLGSLDAMNRDFLASLKDKSYGMIFFSKVNGMEPATLKAARKYGATWYWFMDGIDAARALGAERFAAAADFASATSREVTNLFRTVNARSLQVVEGFDPEILFPEEEEKKIYDLVFIGNATEKRIAEIRSIREILLVTIFGEGWPSEFKAHPPVFGDDYRRTIGRAKIVLNLVHSDIFSDRVIHTLACGGFLLSQHCPDLERHFRKGEDLEWFHELEEFGTLVARYLPDAAAREAIAREGRETAAYAYPWEQVCERVANLSGLNHLPLQHRREAFITSGTNRTNRKEKVLLVSWHGLGDNVMLTPALRKFKEQNPQTEITLLGLKRFGKTLQELLSGLPCLDEILPILPDAWNDFADYDSGVQAVCAEAGSYAKQNGFDRTLLLPTKRKSGYRLHKIFRFAEELGVKFASLEDLQTELSVTAEAEARVEKMLRGYPTPILLVHAVAGNLPKTLPQENVAELIGLYPGYTVFEFGRKSTSRSILIPEDDMEFSKALVKRADMVIAIDSVVMHIAGTFRRPCLAVFTHTPVQQAVPLTYRVDVIGTESERTLLSQWPSFRQEILQKFPSAQKGGFDDRWYYEGGSGCYQGYWWGERGGMGENIHKRMMKIIEAFPEMFRTRRTLDVGCAAGYYVKVLRDSGYEAYGCDPSRWIIKRDETMMTPYKPYLKVGSAQSIPFDEPMDTVLALNVLEHCDEEELQRFLSEMNRLDATNLILQVPQTDDPEAFLDTTHKLVQPRKWWNDRFASLGFQFVKEVPYTGAPIWFYRREKISVPVPEKEKSTVPSHNTRDKERSAQHLMALPEHYFDPSCYWAHMLTFRCNGGCPFCILNGRGRCRHANELSGREILNFWNSIEHPEGQRLSLIGGETTLHPDIVEIVNHLEGYDITITTNCKGPFYNDPDFHKQFRPRPSSNLRINTTFHPHLISPEGYIGVIRKYRETGYFVDQTSFVYRPDINQYSEAIERVRQEIPIQAAPYLGFFDAEHRFEAPFQPEGIEPNERYHDPQRAAIICGLTDLEAYRDLCGQSEKREVRCIHPYRSLIIGPDGNYYHCHYKLYYGIDPVCSIREFRPVPKEPQECRHYGFCNWCDVPRVGCEKNPTARPLVLNKLYDKGEFARPEIRHLLETIESFARQEGLEFNPLKWFEYAYTLLYSGHRHRGSVLDVGSALSVFPYFLAAEGYDVTTLDITDGEFRTSTGRKYGVRSITGDLRKLYPELKNTFDLISNLSVIEHIDDDTSAVLHLARYLKPGGVMVISTDFYENHIEYPDANRMIVQDRPAGSHTDSRVYTETTFLERIIHPLELAGLKRMGSTDFQNVDIHDAAERAVRGLYTFGIATFRKEP